MNVLDASLQRLHFVFANFDNVIVAFSGGKDSGVLLNLTETVAKEFDRTFSIFNLDYECEYSATTRFVDETVERFAHRDIYRCCVPVRSATSTSMFESFWRPWDEEKRDLWTRPLPARHYGKDAFPFYTTDMTDYEFQEAFSYWHHKKNNATRTAVLVGIRSDESLDRWRAIHKDRESRYEGEPWTRRMPDDPDVVNAYPIHDWRTKDIWVANARFAWPYNTLYDLFHFAGVPLDSMRVANPFNTHGKSNLKMYKVLDPDVWGKMVSRVNGVNFMALYGDSKAVAWKNVEKPEHFTWEQYAHFLLDTLPEETTKEFRRKLAVSLAFWRDRGAVLDDEIVHDLQSLGIPMTVSKVDDKNVVRMEYVDDAPIKGFAKVPTWKRLCVTILKNDHVGKYMGFAMSKKEAIIRTNAERLYNVK